MDFSPHAARVVVEHTVVRHGAGCDRAGCIGTACRRAGSGHGGRVALGRAGEPRRRRRTLALARRTGALVGLAALLVSALGSCDSGSEAASAAATPTVHASEFAAVDRPMRHVEVDVAEGHARQWFPSLDEYAADPSFNPSGRRLSAADVRLASDVLAQASATLDSIEGEFSRAQAAIARERIARGAAVRYVPGVTDASLGESAAVVIASVDASGPWLVRIEPDELPCYDGWRTASTAARALALEQLGELMRSESRDSLELGE